MRWGSARGYGKAKKIKDFLSSRCSRRNTKKESAGNEERVSALSFFVLLALPSRTLYHKMCGLGTGNLFFFDFGFCDA